MMNAIILCGIELGVLQKYNIFVCNNEPSGQTSSQWVPIHPSLQMQYPSFLRHLAKFLHLHTWLQFCPKYLNRKIIRISCSSGPNTLLLEYIPFWTWDIACSARPTRSTLACTCDVMTLSAIFARTFQCTTWTICSINARMFTRQPNVAGLTHILAGDMVTRFIAINYIGTFFFAT